MNIQQFLKSGIIESYALGLASPEERVEMESILIAYPEVQNALSDFELLIEMYAIRHGVPPPPVAFDKISDRIRELPVRPEIYPGTGRNGTGRNGAGRSTSPKEEFIHVQGSNTHMWVHKIWKPLFLIVFILSKIFLILGIYYFIQYQHAQEEIKKLEARPAPVEITAPR